MDREDSWRAIAAARLDLADLLEGLEEAEWDKPSLCAGWRVRDVAAHVAMTPLVPGVGRVGDASDVARALQLVDEEPRGLLGDLGLLGEVGEPAAVHGDALEDPRLRRGDVAEPGLGERGEDAGLHRPVRDEQQQPQVQRHGHRPLDDSQSL